MTPNRFRAMLTLLAALLALASFAPAQPAAAQGDAVSELIDLINALRASKGLAPYVVDQGLMALAQEHSEYQASIHTSTHLHSDGRTPPQIGVVENVAGGDIGYLDANAAVYEIWNDPVHGRTMTGYAAGAMGVGIADDGTTAYYTLEVRPAGAPDPKPGTPGTATAWAPLTPIPLATLVPATPGPDGSIIHIVGYGQTLWSIAVAYGIQIDQIRAWNNMAAGENDIYAGQRLLVLPANLAAPSPTPTTGPAGRQDAARQNQNIMVATTGITHEAAITPTPPGILPPTGAVTQAGLTAPTNAGAPEAELAIPMIGGGSLLIGCALLLALRMNKRRP